MKDTSTNPIITSENITSVSHDGREYPVINGAVKVPPEAAAILVASHGFSVHQPKKSSNYHGRK